MTILGRGDLAPPRRGSRRRAPYLAAVVVLALAGAGAGGWFGWRAWKTKPSAQSKPRVVCVTPSPSASLVAVAKVKVRVLNATPTVGLAHAVARELGQRGLTVVAVGNTSQTFGRSRVTYSPGEIGFALAVAEQVPDAELHESSTEPPGDVELDLASDFHHLATPAQAKAARARDVTAAAPRPATCSTPAVSKPPH
jgi:hypothetical protein